jgi:hypothetical protein
MFLQFLQNHERESCRMIPRICTAALLALGLAGCGSTVGDRGLSGAGLGAAAGTAVGAVTGLTLWQGALIGAGVGAAAGALTDQRDIDLGKPLWKRGGAAEQGAAVRPASTSHGATASTTSVVKRVQSSLAAAGYDPGPADGRMGAKTRAAIIHYQQENGLPIDGVPSPQLLEHLNGRSA